MLIKKGRILGVIINLLILAALAIGGFIAWNKLVGKPFAVLILGLEHTRTDTMMVAIIDPKHSRLDIVSLPRDTYYPVEGYDGLGQKKLNAVYGFESEGGPERVMRAAEDLLGIEVPSYIAVDYDGVEAIVDRMGGIEIEVPFPMYYVDPYADPPLTIDLQPGLQRLNGQQALGYLRFRQSSDGSYSDGDLGRIGRQQAFVTQAIRQAIGVNLPSYLSEGLQYVKSNIDLTKAGSIGSAFIGFDMSNLRIHTLPQASIGPGEDGLHYFFHDPDATEALMNKIRSR